MNSCKNGKSRTETVAEQYGAQTVALLRQAHAAGWFKVPARIAELKHDVDRAALRTREDFQKLLQDLQTGVPTK